tara:strand:+ start:222 stop:653 length:432 start_codon:yes stop_codon:yes gene_type:complete
MDISKEIRKIKYIVEDTANVRGGSIDNKTRKREVVLARMVFANFLQFEVGLKEETMTKYLKRDRSSFYHYQKRHNLYMSNEKIYPEYNHLFMQVKLRYYTDEERLFSGVHVNEKLEYLSTIDEKLNSLLREKSILKKEIDILS